MPNQPTGFYCVAKDHVFLERPAGAEIQIDGNTIQMKGPLFAKKVGPGDYDYMYPTKEEGFILRLLLLQLDIPLIIQALKWKFSGTITDQVAAGKIKDVIDKYEGKKKYIRALTDAEITGLQNLNTVGVPPHLPPGKFKKLELNANINQIVPPIFMLSFPPLT